MKVTASINVSKDNIKWSRLATHNQRKTANHSNKNINDKMSRYNGYYQLIDYYKLNLKMIKLSNAKNHWLDDRNKKYKSRGQYKYIETAQELAKKATKKGQNSRNIVIQLGNTQSKEKIINQLKEKKLSKSEQAKVINKTFRNYAEKFNRTHLHNGHGLAITDLDVHNDEKTIHAHGRLVSFYQAKDKYKPAHHTKSGNFKPAKVKKGALKFGFSRGVKAEYGGSTPRVAFKRFRHYEDNQIVNSFSRSLNRSLELTRTGGQTNYTRHEKSMANAIAIDYKNQAHSTVYSATHDFAISMTNKEVSYSKATSQSNESLKNQSLKNQAQVDQNKRFINEYWNKQRRKQKEEQAKQIKSNDRLIRKQHIKIENQKNTIANLSNKIQSMTINFKKYVSNKLNKIKKFFSKARSKNEVRKFKIQNNKPIRRTNNKPTRNQWLQWYIKHNGPSI